MTRYQPRYTAYCIAHGLAPWEMERVDRLRWRGGSFAGFIVWIQERWQEFRALNPAAQFPGAREHAEFDAWLKDLAEVS